MQSFKIGAVSYRSRSAAVKSMLKNTKKSQADIARKVGITAQTVNAINRKYAIRIKAVEQTGETVAEPQVETQVETVEASAVETQNS